MVKRCNLPELETVVSSYVEEAVRTEVKWTKDVKRATDEEGDLSDSKRGTYKKIASESRVKIAKYVEENGIAAAIHNFKKNRHFPV